MSLTAGIPGATHNTSQRGRTARETSSSAELTMGLVSSTLPIPASEATSSDSATVMLAARRSVPIPPAARRSTARRRSSE